MPWSIGSVGIAARFPGGEAAEVDPAWRPWLEMLEIALDEPAHAWDSGLRVRSAREMNAPLLEGAELRIDAGRARALVRRLAKIAGVIGEKGADAAVAPNRIGAVDAIDAIDASDAIEVIRATITRDEVALSAIAERCGASIDAMAVVAQMAAMPALQAAARALGTNGADEWRRGYCPVCGAWPSMAEIRGIERARHLRCGSCSADWSMPLLRCAFCDETDHEKLGSLVPEGAERRRHVETCESCHGYLKAVTTFDALPFRALVLLDLDTIPLDLVAQDRGYARPEWSGWSPDVRVRS
jgi:FdhE protein